MKSEAVIDASVAASWFLSDEDSSAYQHVIKNMHQFHLFAPVIFEYEMLNIVLNSFRRGRLALETQQAIFDVIRHYHVVIRNPRNYFIDSLAAFDLAKEHKLTIYDAAYLSLAIEMGVPLFTYDKALLAAARVLRVATVV